MKPFGCSESTLVESNVNGQSEWSSFDGTQDRAVGYVGLDELRVEMYGVNKVSQSERAKAWH